MKVDILNIEGIKVKSVELPSQFKEEVREDIIKKSFLAFESRKRQEYGASVLAGKRYSSKLSRRRHNYKGAYGRGISRVPRKTILRRGTQFIWVGASAPGTVGGRKAHPPKSEKKWEKKINKKENTKAVRSAMAATVKKGVFIEDKLESLNKTKDLKKVLEKLRLKEELTRLKKKIRAGKGKTRGRKYRRCKGPLIVVSKECPLIKACGNLQGFDISTVDSLNIGVLAPGSVPGRRTIWTLSSIKRIEKEKLFMDQRINMEKEK